jgi:hypothetical protein
MKLAETNYDNKETGCCASLDEARWESQEFVWKDKPFVKDHIREFLHVPLNFGQVLLSLPQRRLSGRIERKWTSSTSSTPPAQNVPSALAKTRWWPLQS